MGYAVYEDIWNGPRWAGYAVPAECDWPDCHERINRGMGYQCESHTDEDDEDNEGCYMYFCGTHLYEDHPDTIKPKDDSAEWKWWLITAPSWGIWRMENPEKLAQYRKDIAEVNFRPTKNLLTDLKWDMEDSGVMTTDDWVDHGGWEDH